MPKAERFGAKTSRGCGRADAEPLERVWHCRTQANAYPARHPDQRPSTGLSWHKPVSIRPQITPTVSFATTQPLLHARHPRCFVSSSAQIPSRLSAELWRDMPARLHKTMTPASRWGWGVSPTVRANLLNFPKAARSPAFRPFEPNTHGRRVLLPDLVGRSSAW